MDGQTTESQEIHISKIIPKYYAQECPVCHGFGSLRYGTRECQGCNGKGYIFVPTGMDGGIYEKPKGKT